ncbi:probable actin-histidine N-methyltransferase [Coccomyxa sp. Obi]|nr:probable actin-histidine N-methyltransferase [Coccomyxa sp. Obi]
MINSNKISHDKYITSNLSHRPAFKPFRTGFQAGRRAFARWTGPIERFTTCTAVSAKPAEQQRGSQIRESSSNIQQWALQLGIQCPKLTVADFAGLRGMAATADIAGGDVLVSLPVTAALVVSPKERSQLPASFCSGAFYSKKPWYVQMALKLLYERKLGPESKLAPYVAALPAEFSTPLSWTEAQLQALRYPHLLQEVAAQREGLKKLHAELAESTPGTPISEQDLIWALQAVRSRAFSGPYAGPTWQSRLKTFGALGALAAASITVAHVPLEQVLNGAIAAALFNLLYDVVLSQKVKWYAMCPIVDFLNHKSSVQSEVEYEYFADRFSVRCQSSFSKGEQVFISYGRQSNDSLLQYYGFVEPSILHDTYTLPDFRAAALALGDSVQVPAVNALPQSSKGILTRSGPDSKTQDLLKAAQLSKGEISKVVSEICRRELQRFEGEVASDSDLARAFRKEKRAVLEACMRAALASK